MVQKNSEILSGQSSMLMPVAALTRFRPDTRNLNDHSRERAAYIRQGVKVGAMGLLLPYQEKVEIIEQYSVCPIPNTPMWFMGMINNRGNLLPVFDIKLLMEIKADMPSRWLMVLGHGSKAVGLCIDTLPAAIVNPQQVSSNEIDIQANIPSVLRPHLAGEYSHNGTLWMDIKYENLFLDICARF